MSTTTKGTFCPRCGAGTKESWQFCRACGSPLVEDEVGSAPVQDATPEPPARFAAPIASEPQASRPSKAHRRAAWMLRVLGVAALIIAAFVAARPLKTGRTLFMNDCGVPAAFYLGGLNQPDASFSTRSTRFRCADAVNKRLGISGIALAGGGSLLVVASVLQGGAARRSRRLKLAGFSGSGVAALAGLAIFLSGPQPPKPLVFVGMLTVYDSAFTGLSEEASCGEFLPRGYEDIYPGAEVRVFSESNRLVGVGQLSSGRAFDGGCLFNWRVEDPSKTDFYRIRVGHDRGEVTRSFTDLTSDEWKDDTLDPGWIVRVTLGDDPSS